ncbi:MAG: hypothetical protein ACNYZH_00450 [Acidimicrobiia bacterium]
MWRRWLLVLTASVVLVTACVQDDTATTAAAASPVTIMHIGEGVTQGDWANSTYRCFLDAMLHDTGVAFDFVGSRQKPADGYEYTCPSDFDQDHEAWAGAQIGGLETDMMTQSAQRLASFITDVQQVNPDITLLIGSLIPCRTPLPWCTEDYPVFNDAIASFGNLSTDESMVIVVDMTTGMSTDLLRSNNLEFTDAGDEVMASRWMTALEESVVISTGS